MAPESSSSSTGRGGLGPRSSSYAGLLDLIQRHWAGGASPPATGLGRATTPRSPRARRVPVSRAKPRGRRRRPPTPISKPRARATRRTTRRSSPSSRASARTTTTPGRRTDPRAAAPRPPDRAAAHWSAECDLASWLVVRGAKYLRDRVKVASAPPAMECVGVDLFSFDDVPHAHVAERRPESWLRRRRAERANRTSRANEKPPPWTFVFQFMNPGPPYVSIACISAPRASARA